MGEEGADKTADEQLADLRERLGRLARMRDPAQRDRLAVELVDESKRVLRAVRKKAAQDAVASGQRPSDYARSIGVSPGAVDHLLHR
jgi:hypothetical protein